MWVKIRLIYLEHKTPPFTLEYDSEVSITIYDLNGRQVRNLYNGSMDAGANDISINRDGLQSGLYLCKVAVSNGNGIFEESKKLVIK
ncbi:T9SS type A sorting domain-containing protein [Flavobacterium sp.]|uniref:T9SS type A sorting domain-containing protein n=1 Tax=Flavobacterium sp. TaxID=239 RepID=UPI004033E2FD